MDPIAEITNTLSEAWLVHKANRCQTCNDLIDLIDPVATLCANCTAIESHLDCDREEPRRPNEEQTD